jgi:hypothetical protein
MAGADQKAGPVSRATDWMMRRRPVNIVAGAGREAAVAPRERTEAAALSLV